MDQPNNQPDRITPENTQAETPQVPSEQPAPEQQPATPEAPAQDQPVPETPVVDPAPVQPEQPQANATPSVPPPAPGPALNTTQSIQQNSNPNVAPSPMGLAQGAYLPKSMNAGNFGKESYHEDMMQKAHYMRDLLRQQPKVWAMVPLQPGEKPGTMLPVGINGYFIYIKKGVMVQVPQQVGAMIAESFNLDYENGADIDLSKNEDKQRALA